mgnify:CR=1 FL=1
MRKELVTLLMCGLSLSCPSAGAQSVPLAELEARDLIRLADQPPGTGLPPDWRQRAVRGQKLPSSAIEDGQDDRVWVVSGTGTAGWFAFDRRDAPISSNAILILSSRLAQVPTESDLTVPELSDSALRLFVIFESQRAWLSRPRMIMYSFGRLGRDDPVAKPQKALCDIRIPRGASRAWSLDALRPGQDAIRLFDWTPQKIQAVGILLDSDQTRSFARADFRTLMAVQRRAQ